MVKLTIFISIFLLSLTVNGQRYHRVVDGEIVQSGMPDVFTYPNGSFIYGGYKNLPDSIHYRDGWRVEVVPEWNQGTQRLGALYYNVGMDYVTREVIDLTPEELAARKDNLLQSIDDEFDYTQIKQLLRLLSKPLLSDTASAEELEVLTHIYPQYRVGKSYAVNDVFVSDSTLYRVVQAHTSQADWLPSATPALYTPYTPPGQIADWVQPTGAHDAYKIGDKVLFNGKVYESVINANVWSPTVYPAGWKLIG